MPVVFVLVHGACGLIKLVAKVTVFGLKMAADGMEAEVDEILNEAIKEQERRKGTSC